MLELIKAICRKEPRGRFSKMTFRILEELQIFFFSFMQQILYCVPSLAEKAVPSSFFKKMNVWGISHFKKTFSFA